MLTLRRFSILCLSLLLLSSCNEKTDSANSTPAPESSNPCLDILNKQLGAAKEAAALFNAGETSINQWLIQYGTPDHSQLSQILKNIENSLGLGVVSGGVVKGFGFDTYLICVDQAANKNDFEKAANKKVAEKAAAAPSDNCPTLFGTLSSDTKAVQTALVTLETSLNNAIGVASDPSKVKAAAEVVVTNTKTLSSELDTLANFVDNNKPQLSTCSSPSKPASK